MCSSGSFLKGMTSHGAPSKHTELLSENAFRHSNSINMKQSTKQIRRWLCKSAEVQSPCVCNMYVWLSVYPCACACLHHFGWNSVRLQVRLFCTRWNHNSHSLLMVFTNIFTVASFLINISSMQPQIWLWENTLLQQRFLLFTFDIFNDWARIKKMSCFKRRKRRFHINEQDMCNWGARRMIPCVQGKTLNKLMDVRSSDEWWHQDL